MEGRREGRREAFSNIVQKLRRIFTETFKETKETVCEAIMAGRSGS